jgi:DNA repair protein RadC
MIRPFLGVRELDVRYKPGRVALPVAGDVGQPREAARVAMALLADMTVEHVIALHVDTKHHLIGVHYVSVGTLDGALVHPRDVFKAALLTNAAGLIVAHNHPSGDPTPSPDDQALVARLVQAGVLLGVELRDALIVTDPTTGGRYYSFREAGTLR